MSHAENNSLFLVHGNVAHLPQDEEVNHAWVENESTVFDYSNGIYTKKAKADYYEQLKISTTRKYKPIEAFQLSILHGHYGPWTP